METQAPLTDSLAVPALSNAEIADRLASLAPSHGFWVAPLPFTFLGVGLIAYHYLLAKPGR
jgi:hypothetical protein